MMTKPASNPIQSPVLAANRSPKEGGLKLKFSPSTNSISSQQADLKKVSSPEAPQESQLKQLSRNKSLNFLSAVNRNKKEKEREDDSSDSDEQKKALQTKPQTSFKLAGRGEGIIPSQRKEDNDKFVEQLIKQSPGATAVGGIIKPTFGTLQRGIKKPLLTVASNALTIGSASTSAIKPSKHTVSTTGASLQSKGASKGTDLEEYVLN